VYKEVGRKDHAREAEKNRGILYNAEAVDACLGLFRETGFGFE
jgi:hypothetical protein